jgi:Flp pilus assembly protein TadG
MGVLERRPRPNDRRGSAVVEFAVIAPFLILLLFGMIDVGRAIMVQNLLTNAARDGARAAILDGTTVADVQSLVQSYLAGSSVPGATVNVTPDPLTSAEIGDPVTVSVQIPFDTVSWLPSSWYFGGIDLSSTVVMRRETTSSSSSSSGP